MKRQSGFSLIEVLVTLVLVTTGVLGMVAMQGRSIQYSQESAQRNAAADLTHQLVELMRANPGLVFDSVPPVRPVSSDLKKTSMFYKKKGSSFDPAPATLTAGACTAPDTPQKQRDCWLKQVISKLPNASALFNEHLYICRSSGPSSSSTPKCDNKGSTLEVQLAWSAKKGACPDNRAPNETTCIYRTRIEL